MQQLVVYATCKLWQCKNKLKEKKNECKENAERENAENMSYTVIPASSHELAFVSFSQLSPQLDTVQQKTANNFHNSFLPACNNFCTL